MTLLEKCRFLTNKDLSKNAEETANRYAIRCISITVLLVIVIWLLNQLNLFIIDKQITTATFSGCLLCYFIGLLPCIVSDISKPCMKYYIIAWAVAIITCITMHLTYHAFISSVVPIVLTSIYSSKPLRVYTVILMIVSTFISVYYGYYAGICDANMVLLTTTSLPNYIGENHTFLLTKINNNPQLTLGLFYVFPRSLLLIVLATMSGSISKIISMNTNYATEMRHLAERDQMTGAYTKTKYLTMLENDYIHEERIGIIFWDLNFLKHINDTMGHEYGDKLIFTIASSIRALNNANDKTYRIGGDEFVMIMRGATEKTVKEKIAKWLASLQSYESIGDIRPSASYGYAWGSGRDIQQIIHDADQMMYQNKRKYHETCN